MIIKKSNINARLENEVECFLVMLLSEFNMDVQSMKLTYSIDDSEVIEHEFIYSFGETSCYYERKTDDYCR